MPKLLHPIEDARKALSLGRTRFYEEVRAGRIVIVKAGKKSLVPQSSLDNYVAAKIAEATGEAA
jgi:hypothetical protein